MELICPSCEARYQIPEGAIGEKGRQVSCMSCGHVWHAVPPLMLGAPLASAESLGINMPRRESAAPERTRAFADGMDEMDGRDDRMTPPSSRSEQLAEIRQMLAEVQSDAAGQTGSGTSTSSGGELGEPVLVAERGTPDQSANVDDGTLEDFDEAPHSDSSDPLRDRIAQQSRSETKVKEPNVGKLQKRHQRREREHQRAKAAGSGAFLTGFLLVVIIIAVMAALYLLKPEIVQQMPESEQAMNEYTDTIDAMRLSFAETFGAVRDWFIERGERLL